MPSPIHTRITLMKSIAEKLGLPPIQTLAKQPGTQSVHRITFHYFDARLPERVATLSKTITTGIRIEAKPSQNPNEKLDIFPITPFRFEQLTKSLQSIHFDTLPDQEELPYYDSVDLWMVERAAGTFHHNVIVAPALALDASVSMHARLVNLIRNVLPEAVR